MTTYRGPVIVPTVHLNGTSKDELLKQLADVMEGLRDANSALRDAEIAMAQATPHDRDYYVQGPRHGHEARHQNSERRRRLIEMKEELGDMARDIYNVIEGIKAQGR
jgi:hypothetical protein